jgi:gliding motility-associated-like protein
MKTLFPLYKIKACFLILFLCCFYPLLASHIVGGEVSYKYLGETEQGALSIYTVSISIYEDCLNGSVSAIADDDPAYLIVYANDKTTSDPILNYDTTFIPFDNAVSKYGCYNGYFYDSLYHTASIKVPTGFSNQCVTNVPQTCLTQKTFTKTYYLPHNTQGYMITYQRCCRNAEIDNIRDPGNTGSTFYCTIPAWPLTNNSAVFKNYPPQIICLDNPLYYDNSATDADGDSLSYEFCVSLDCCNSPDAMNICVQGPDQIFSTKPVPPPPDEPAPLYYDSIIYNAGYSSSQPLPGFPPIQINPATGIISGTPNQTGRYLVTICCNEWRHGVIINTNKREFQFVVTPCSKTVVADIPQYSTDFNTYIVECRDNTVSFVNTSTGGFSWYWNFGVPDVSGDTSSGFEPTFTYPDTGTYNVTLVANPGTTCTDSITRLVKIYPVFLANFSDSGLQCPGDSISFQDLTMATVKPITYWKWNFGDGDSSYTENPVHSYANGGTYNVALVSENIKDCVDTVLKQVLIEKFKPFAGDDTIVVKGASVLFDATGGINYSWSPDENLNSASVYDPLGYFPDTGQYSYVVQVQSQFGCYGSDTIVVTVVDQAEFFVPTGFTPNGDGKNDIFKPIAVGYKTINYFAVYNRWGARVYLGNSFEEGWDGTYNGDKAPIGSYYWEISFVDRFGKPGFLKGDVTLIR